MKTIAIFSGYHLPHLGGIERYTDNLSKQLVNQGYKVIIISSNYMFEKEYHKVDNNIEFYKLPVRQLFISRYPIPNKNKEFYLIMDDLKTKNIDVIIVNTRFHLTSLVGAKFGKKNHIPVFLIEHGSQHLTVDNKVLDFFGAIYEHCLTSVVKKYVNYYYGVSKGACNWQKHFGITSNGVWYNSIVDFSSDYEIKKDDKNINILYAGRILKQKGVSELIEAFKRVNKPNTTLFIAGDGNLLPSLKETYKDANIVFLGKLNFKELCEYYAKTNIFVYAPIWPEGLPTGILEAGLMKCAVIGSPQGGIKEIIENNKTGLMINNVDELTESLSKLIDDKELRMTLADNLEKEIREQFIWDQTAKKIINDIENKIG